MKRAWDLVKLRVNFWHAERAAEVGDELHTATGRRYQILGIKGKVLECLILPKDAPVAGYVFGWEWSKRTRTCNR